MNRTLRILIALCLSVSLLLTGCSGASSTSEVPTRVVTDVMGREVVIPQNPKRVACLYASTAHMLAMIGVEDRIVGVPAGVKRDILMQRTFPGIVDVSVPFQDGIINVEELASLDVDVALIREGTAASPGEVEKLDKLGIPYVVVDYASIDELRHAVEVVGDVFDERQRADDYVRFVDDTLSLVETRLQGLGDEEIPHVYHAVNEATRSDVKGDICDEITTVAGVFNVAANSESQVVESTGESFSTLEQIYEWNPDYIVANDANVVDYVLGDSKWSGLRAVAGKKVFPLPVGVTRWAHPGSMEPQMGALFLARQFHPDRMTGIDLAVYTKDYYAKFFGLELDDSEIQEILIGKGMRAPKSSG